MDLIDALIQERNNHSKSQAAVQQQAAVINEVAKLVVAEAKVLDIKIEPNQSIVAVLKKILESYREKMV